MATTMTFNSLKSDITVYIERGAINDPTVYAQIPTLINLAEREIATSLKILGFIVPLVDTLRAGVSVYSKPDRWRETVSMGYGSGLSQNERNPIFPRAYEYCRMYWPNSDDTSLPEFYADYDYNHWLVVPTPDIDYPWEVLAYMLPPLLDTTNQTNWTTAYAPTALLYGTLMKCAPFLKDDPRIPVWQSNYDRELQLLNGQDLQRIIDRSTSRQED